MVVEPNENQHPDIQKLYLNVKILEDVTNDALSTFFSDKENSNNAKKKPFLKEIFRVAKQEERYKNGEIGMAHHAFTFLRIMFLMLTLLTDAEQTIHVMADDNADNYQSDNEDGTAREEETGPTSIPSSESSHKSTAPHGLVTNPCTEHSPGDRLHGGPFANDLPVRPAQYSQSLITSELVPDQHQYEGGGIAAGTSQTLQSHGSMAMNEILAPHDVSRRASASVYNSPTGYSNASSTSIYNPNNWQTASTTSSTAPMYADAYPQQQQQQHHPAPPPSTVYVQQQPVLMAQSQPYMAGFDGMARGYDSGQDAFLRPSPVSHNPVTQSPGYPTYTHIHHDNRALPGTGYKLDPLGRNLH